MKVTVEWLKEYVATDATPDEIGATLTMLGLELEALEDSDLGPVLDFKVTPNRGDCLSILGLARELCAKEIARFHPTPLFADAVRGWLRGGEQSIDIVTIESPGLCPRYGARFFSGVNCSTPSTEKLQRRLAACGMRPINVVVDTTNYVMLELGQPLHAFDRTFLKEGRIVVRKAEPGEKMKTLDGAERTLTPEMLMICDAEKPIAIAGVMGGENSEVSDGTKEILLESAHFDPVSVRKTRRGLGMSTEASYRFERYVDPEGVVRSLNRFADLLKEQTGIDCQPGLCDVYPQPPQSKQIAVREAKWSRHLGMDIPISAAASSLQALGCSVTETDGGLQMTTPTWRPDLVQEEDLIEEIGRLWGYDKIPETLPYGSTPLGGETPSAAFRTRARGIMLRLGFTEVVSHTLCGTSPLDPKTERVTLRNPAAPELSLLRASLLPGLAQTASNNRGRALHLFESGRIFAGNERRSLAFLMSGRLLPDDWKDKSSPNADFFVAKGIVEQAAAHLGRNVEFEPSNDPRFHPTRQGAIQGIGIFGEVEPTIAEDLDLPVGTLLGEICLDRLESSPEIERLYLPLSPYPSVRRDLAFTINKTVPYANLEDAVTQAIGDLGESVRLLDAYEGKGIAPGEHSLTITLTLRRSDRTLTDEDANSAQQEAFQALESLGARRRS